MKPTKKKPKKRIMFSVRLTKELDDRLINYMGKNPTMSKTKIIQAALDEYLPRVRVIKRGVE